MIKTLLVIVSKNTKNSNSYLINKFVNFKVNLEKSDFKLYLYA